MNRYKRWQRWLPMLSTVPFSLILLTALAGPGQSQPSQGSIYGVFEGDTVYTVLPPDAIPAILEPEFVSGAEAVGQMADDEPILGITIAGESRAYSLWHLDSHEIVNDTIGGTAIAVTW
jgi:hypothetical protein